MNFFKQNWFKLSIAISIVVASLSVAYYFAIFLPNEEKGIEYEIAKEIEKLDTTEEKAKYWNNLIEDGIITKDNSSEIIETLYKNGEYPLK